jgi:hypothetical protein
MKHPFASASLALLLGLQPFALPQAPQAARQELFDIKKSGRDLEVMKGIIKTTLGFVSEEIRGPRSAGQYGRIGEFYGPSSINAYYLVGQGAVFTIPASNLSNSYALLGEDGELVFAALSEEKLSQQAKVLAEQSAELQYQAARMAGEVSAAAMAGGKVIQTPVIVATPPPPPPPPPLPGSSAAPSPAPAPAIASTAPRARTSGEVGGVAGGVGYGVGSSGTARVPNEEKMRQKVVDVQERMKKQQESQEQRRVKFQESLVKFKSALLEALGNHGDSLSQVKPNEYITIIISEDGRLLPQSLVLSVQKSVISDYKAGRISPEAFRAKVLDYSTEE